MNWTGQWCGAGEVRASAAGLLAAGLHAAVENRAGLGRFVRGHAVLAALAGDARLVGHFGELVGDHVRLAFAAEANEHTVEDVDAVGGDAIDLYAVDVELERLGRALLEERAVKELERRLGGGDGSERWVVEREAQRREEYVPGHALLVYVDDRRARFVDVHVGVKLVFIGGDELRLVEVELLAADEEGEIGVLVRVGVVRDGGRGG